MIADKGSNLTANFSIFFCLRKPFHKGSNLTANFSIFFCLRKPFHCIVANFWIFRDVRDSILKLLRSPGIDSASLRSLAGWCDNRIPTRFLAPIECSKNLALVSNPESCLSKQARYLLSPRGGNATPLPALATWGR